MCRSASRQSGPTDPRLAFDPADPALGGNVIGGDRHTYHPELWSFLVERLRIESMLDVGCGEGHCVKFFSDLGVRAEGFDGLRANVQRAVTPIRLHDLRWGPYVRPVDLVHCCEVVEHVEEQYLPHLLQTLANGRTVVMTHAVPGQGGHHHVNCRPEQYWIEHVESMGYEFMQDLTAQARAIKKSTGEWTYFGTTGLVFCRSGRSECDER